MTKPAQKCLLAVFVFSFVVHNALAEEYLEKGDSRILGHKVNNDKFTTCGGVNIDLSTIGEHTIKSTSEKCSRDPDHIKGERDSERKALDEITKQRQSDIKF
jgi:hypothetical protein